MADADKTWWGEFDVPADAWSRWTIGPLTLWARRTQGEWRLAWIAEADPLITDLRREIPVDAEPDETLDRARYALEDPGTGLRLAPRLADLPVVVRPETPLWIPPGQKTLLYVGTVVWIAIAPAGDGSPRLMEMPVRRPSDTWFGTNTRFGELCYASRTRARTDADLLGHIPHRAVTPVEITNEGIDALNIAYLRIPVPALGLYQTPGGRLWTEAVSFRREHGLNDAEVDILHNSGFLPEGSRLVDEPREPMHQKTVIRAFSSLFG